VQIPASALPGVELVATVIAARQSPIAVIREARFGRRVVRCGDRVGDRQVAAILDGRLLLRHVGGLEFLPLVRTAVSGRGNGPTLRRRPPDRRPRRGLAAAIRQIGKKRWEIGRKALRAALANPRELTRTMRVFPAMRGGKPDGFKLAWLSVRSPLRALGLQRGDVLQALNGKRVATAEDLLTVYTKLRNASHVNVGLRRRGRQLSLDYRIRD